MSTPVRTLHRIAAVLAVSVSLATLPSLAVADPAPPAPDDGLPKIGEDFSLTAPNFDELLRSPGQSGRSPPLPHHDRSDRDNGSQKPGRAGAQSENGPDSSAPSEQTPSAKPDKPRVATPPTKHVPKSPPGMMGLPFPASPDDAPKTLESLYAFLATEPDKRQGGEIGAAIEKLWRYTGSDTVNLLIDRSDDFASKNVPERAMPLMDAAVDLAPEYAEAWSHRAYLHYRMENFSAALADLRRALSVEPNHFRALEGMAKILVILGEKKAALSAYRKLVLMHPNIEGGKEALEALEKELEGQGI